jgi:hypothetical protein
VLAKVLGRLEGLRGELEELRAERRRSDARIARLEESKGCEEEQDKDDGESAQRPEVRLQQVELNFDSPPTRRMQMDSDRPQAVDAEPAYILKRQVTRINSTRSEGRGHRRTQAGDGYGNGEGTCDSAALPSRTEAITTECCDEPSEDCTGGYPHTCNEGCAALFLPFWDDCRLALGKDSGSFEPVVALCAAASPPAAALSLAQQLNVQCTDGTATVDCVPECSEAYHGYLLLLNIESDDSKLSCELHRGLYSWVGAANDGGFMGHDAHMFLAAIRSHAPGLFFLAISEDLSTKSMADIIDSQTASMRGGTRDGKWPVWSYIGDDAAFKLSAGASLEIRQVVVDSASGLAFQLASESTLLGDFGVPSGPLSCSALTLERTAAACDDSSDESGAIRVGGPLFVTSAGTATTTVSCAAVPDWSVVGAGTVTYDDPTRHFGAVASYSCAHGYRITSSSDEKRTCQIGGVWAGVAPTCTECWSHYCGGPVIGLSATYTWDSGSSCSDPPGSGGCDNHNGGCQTCKIHKEPPNGHDLYGLPPFPGDCMC